MANLKAIVRIYLHQSRVFLGQVVCKIRMASTWPFKGNVDYRSQSLPQAVSNFHLSADGPLLDQ